MQRSVVLGSVNRAELSRRSGDPQLARLVELFEWSSDLHPWSVARRDVRRVLAGADYATSFVVLLYWQEFSHTAPLKYAIAPREGHIHTFKSFALALVSARQRPPTARS